VAGERIFGFLPMSRYLVVEPARITSRGFVDASAHRSALFPTYNGYARAATPTSRDEEHLQALLRPLLLTSFVLDDYLADNACFGAPTVLLSSASSKTALGAAFGLRQRGGVRVVGLSAARHLDFVVATRCFDAVHGYDDIAALTLQAPVVYVDFSGGIAIWAGTCCTPCRSAPRTGRHWRRPLHRPAWHPSRSSARRRSASGAANGARRCFRNGTTLRPSASRRPHPLGCRSICGKDSGRSNRPIAAC
jgi:Protein of unknown function (DUF2855)